MRLAAAAAAAASKVAKANECPGVVVHASTQHPTEVQHVCARLLGCDFNRVTVVVRRLGGAMSRSIA